MRKIILNYFILLLLVPLFFVYSQDGWNVITVSDSIINFGSISTEQTHQHSITIYNHQNFPAQVGPAEFIENEFATELEYLEIPANGSVRFNIFFNSSQNLNYTDFLRIESSTGIHPLIIEVSAQANHTNSFYDPTQNLSGDELKSALYNIIKHHTELSYTDLWDALSDTDEDPNNSDNVLLLYSGWSYPKTKNGGDPDEWNREHVWAKSHGDFGNTAPAGTDAHHIRPTDVSVNGKRGNLDFDNGGTEYYDAGSSTGCYFDSDSWEPRDEVKGDVARMMYYMVVRYEGDEGYDLELVDYTPSTTDNDPLFGKKSTLYNWNLNDTVSSWEINRNNKIYNNWQGNRNPFIDYPQFANRLPDLSGIELVNNPKIAASPSSVNLGEIGFHYSKKYYIALINTGTADLIINSISSSNPLFEIGITGLTLVMDTYNYLQVGFQSDESEGIYSTNIQIESNDPIQPLIEIPVTIEVKDGASLIADELKPGNFELLQNYPNPFNSQTTIEFNLTDPTTITIGIFSASAQKITDLVSGTFYSAGNHRVQFDASNLATGVYYYKINTGKQSIIRKMILLK
jgi:endonuclease I